MKSAIAVFAESVVRNKLLLSKQQRASIDKVLTKLKKDEQQIDLASFDPFGALPAGAPPVASDKNTLEKNALVLIVGQLRADQVHIFKAIVGKPFDFSRGKTPCDQP